MYISFNGDLHSSALPILTAQNPSFKWGDGIFETMKFYKGSILLHQYHFDRLFLSLKMLQIEADESFTPQKISAAISHLCAENNCTMLARIRLAVFRNEKNKADYLIEAIPLPEEYNQWNERGWSKANVMANAVSRIRMPCTIHSGMPCS